MEDHLHRSLALLALSLFTFSCQLPEKEVAAESVPAVDPFVVETNAIPEPVVLEPIHEIGAWITDFRKSPDPDRVSMAIEEMSEQSLFANADQIVVGFFVEVFRMYPDRVAVWAKEWTTLPESEQQVLCIAVWLSGIQEAAAILNGFLPHAGEGFTQTLQQCLTKEPTDILDAPLSPSVLDALWAGYFASNRPELVARIVDALELPHEQEDGINNLAIWGAAKWSLSSNASQHEDVLFLLQQMAESAEEGRRNALEDMLKEVRE